MLGHLQQPSQGDQSGKDGDPLSLGSMGNASEQRQAGVGPRMLQLVPERYGRQVLRRQDRGDDDRGDAGPEERPPKEKW